MTRGRNDNVVQEIEAAELQRARESGELWQVLDVREAWETEIASIRGTIIIPMSQLPGRLGELDRHRPLAVLCHSGQRSRRVSEYLLSIGFERVVNVRGGIDAWAVTVDPTLARY
ncbi:MAG: rhodanese-like domain-containing protein [Woeseiaceae bacterium]